MRILGIETSCDETAAAVVENGRKIITNVVASSAKMHQKYGGIVPEIAARRQVEVMIPVIAEALQRAECEEQSIDAIAVAVGPGLVGSLLIGIETAKALAWHWEKPIVPVNHLVGHLYAAWINKNAKLKIKNSKLKLDSQNSPQFPILGLVASGGHTDLVLMKGHGKIRQLGSTRDDAAGEAFDKIARLLGLSYPGGPAISAEANKFKIQNAKCKIKLPRPMINSKDYDFSFSGLKTAVINRIRNYELGTMDTNFITSIAFEVQESICEVLVVKVRRAVEEFKPKSLIVAGGVAANKHLRKMLKEKISKSNLKSQLFIPPINLCTDNAAYIASAAYYNYHPTPWKKIKVQPNLSISQ